MKESYDEGIASHIGPESCGGVRKDAVEALTGVRAGWPLNPESSRTGVPTRILLRGRPHRVRTISQDLTQTPRDPRPHARTETSCERRDTPPGGQASGPEAGRSQGLARRSTMARVENPKGASRR